MRSTIPPQKPTSMAVNPFQRQNIKSRKRKDGILYFVIVLQTLIIFLLLGGTKPSGKNSYLVKSLQPSKDDGYNLHPFYDYPKVVYPTETQISRVWHSNGSPYINPKLKQGSCWCSADDYCMCTPSIAIDTILTSGDDHFWLVKRKDAGKYATMGGFVEVGETSEDAVRRELMEEMNVNLGDDANTFKRIRLFGVYGDPMRDARRHTVSVVYVVDVPDDVIPKAGDDAAEVVRIRFDEINNMSFFADHKNILQDYIKMKRGKAGGSDLEELPLIRRSLCSE
jgi:8-oxo-dGTP diphosphatase